MVCAWVLSPVWLFEVLTHYLLTEWNSDLTQNMNWSITSFLCRKYNSNYNIISLFAIDIFQFSSFQSLSCVQLFVTPWTAARQASLSITNSQSLLKLMSIGLVMPSNHLILCCPLLLLPSIFPCIRVFSNESALHIRWPKYWNFSFNISPSNEHQGLMVTAARKLKDACSLEEELWPT